ncbi:MAG: alanine dehydrogenase [Ekhidna sp.]|nr:alanine dehydrogenase [Ekhidna sp.]
MSKKIGLIREGKVPIDRRVPLSPSQAKLVKEKFGVELVVQSSDIRCFSDRNYRETGLDIVESVEDCDIIFGVKEVPLEKLVPGKTYFFFSHTIKKQEYNRKLLQTILAKEITLVDWETLVNEHGNRIIAFGRWAGIVGAYNGLWAYGKRYHLFSLRRAHKCFDYEDLKTEYAKIKLPNIKIAITGGGRVAKGAMEVLHGVGIRKVTAHDFLSETFNEPVFTQLNSRDYHKRIDEGEFHRKEFYSNPKLYKGDFLKYAKVTDLLIAGAFWEPSLPVLFNREDIVQDDFDIKVIADITCDIEGSIPSTKRASMIEDPIYDYNPSDDLIEQALTDEGNITVMAVDNLPCELPRDASESFGCELINNVLSHLLESDEDNVIKNATITTAGSLTNRYSYLQDYVDGK